MCSTHMFCSIFCRVLSILETKARNSTELNIIEKCNNWFTRNNFAIEFKKTEDITLGVQVF